MRPYAGRRTDRTDLGSRSMPRSTLKQYAVTVASSLALGASLLTSCSSESAAPAPLDPASSETSPSGDPTPSPSGDSSASGSATTAGPPTLPPDARGATRASAGPFVHYWVDTLNYATTHLAPSAIRQISFPLCQACNEAAALIAKVKRNGGEMRGEGWRLTRAQLLPPGAPRRPQVRAYITFAPSVVIPERGEEPQRFSGGKKTVYTFELGVRKGRWATAGIVGVPQ